MEKSHAQSAGFLLQLLQFRVQLGGVGLCVFGARQVVRHQLLQRLGAIFLLGQQVAELLAVIFENVRLGAEFADGFVLGQQVDQVGAAGVGELELRRLQGKRVVLLARRDVSLAVWCSVSRTTNRM